MIVAKGTEVIMAFFIGSELLKDYLLDSVTNNDQTLK